jgi:alanine racemase
VTRFRPTVAEVDLSAIAHNVRAMKPDGTELMAVVKADGYGHGAAPVARAALGAGATWLGVALVEEGMRLREDGVDAPILVLSEFPPGSEKDALAAGLTPSVYSEAGLAGVAGAAEDVGRAVGVHVKVDTGMHRVGLYPPLAAVDLVRKLVDSGLSFEGLWTHFARAEEEEKTTRAQLRELLAVAAALEAEGFAPRYRHAANSAAVVQLPESHLDLVRVGVALYGLDPGQGVGERAGLRPALRLRSAVSMVKRLPAGEGLSYGHVYRLQRDATIATVPIGYADGYPRGLSSRGEVLIRGRRRPVAGTVTMDHILVDCGNDQVESGDEVVLLGSQGDEAISAEEIAGLLGTITYEVVCSIGPRVPREYRE